MIEAGVLDDKKVELLNGEICQMPSEGAPHSYFGGSLADQFRDNLTDRALVRNANPITLPDSEPEPDIAIVKGSWRDYRYRHPYPEDVLLIVEVASSSLQKDLGLKRTIYATAGIPEYWVLNINQSELVVFRDLRDGDYQSERRLNRGDVSPLAFPDISFSVGSLLDSL